MDVVNHVKALPLPGETLTGMGTVYHHGGKGANQAIAAARSGSNVTMFAAAIAVTRSGAQESIPYANEVSEFLKAYSIR